MQINDQGTFYIDGEYKAGDIILTVGDWELKADVDGYKKYAFGYEPDDFPELVTNGTFDTGVSGWNEARISLTSISNVSGKLRASSVNTNTNGVQTEIQTDIGKKYILNGEIFRGTMDGSLFIRVSENSTLTVNIQDLPFSNPSDGSFEIEFIASENITYIGALAAGFSSTGMYFEIDNISVKLAHPQSGDPLQLGNGRHRDFRYFPYKLSATEITEMLR